MKPQPKAQEELENLLRSATRFARGMCEGIALYHWANRSTHLTDLQYNVADYFVQQWVYQREFRPK